MVKRVWIKEEGCLLVHLCYIDQRGFESVLRIHFILMMRIRDPQWKNGSWSKSWKFLQDFLSFFNKRKNFKYLSSSFSLILMLNLDDKPFSDWISLLDLSFKSESFFSQFLIDILPLGSESVVPHIFAESDPGSQNVADPKHWFELWKKVYLWLYRSAMTSLFCSGIWTRRLKAVSRSEIYPSLGQLTLYWTGARDGDNDTKNTLNRMV